MKEPFDLNIGGIIYAVFPEENDIYTIFKEGTEYLRIQREENNQWIKLNAETDFPVFDDDKEVKIIGGEIGLFKEENE